MAEHYAEQYGLIKFAGSDNHTAAGQAKLGGMQSDTPLSDELDFIERVRSGDIKPFRFDVEQIDK